MADYIGKDVSIKLKRNLGIFQGKILEPSPDFITITNVFHNGVKIKKIDAEVTIAREEIESISFIQLVDPVVASQKLSARNTPVTPTKQDDFKDPQIPDGRRSAKKQSPQNFTNRKVNNLDNNRQHKATKPIPIRRNTPNNNGHTSASAPVHLKVDQMQNKRHNNKKRNKNFDLMQPDDFSDQGDFDFESNNAMFDKKSVFQEIEANIYGKNPEKPDLVRHTPKTEEKYRHDENVLDSMFMQFRNIQLEFKPKQEYTTDEPGVVIPSIPQSLRNRIQNLAADHGYTMERQNDCLARGATELALQLLGGSRRLSPKNLHQWPRVVIICDEPYNFKQSEIGLITGRQLASHGVNVMVHVKTSTTNSKESKELELYTASGNDFTGNASDLPPSDLIILAVSNMNLNSQIVRYIQNNRAMVMAIDPPVMGVNPGEISIKNTVVPILPLDDIHNTCGKLHLVNLCISDKFFKDAGIKYFPVFGSKFMVPLHLKN
ncbi:hypothetical protein PVAND_007678 [Polypedilum vanderplanki]|uniref:Enhancer of mRNA-decapping protein 3 n=1 Tax=Polypedilum vanderplanki TaxID=319348 RepID=A0A9J6C8J2_POLVA|nr:hypothetical protein PVAND_007678 [Polypedilum vanderplanki]